MVAKKEPLRTPRLDGIAAVGEIRGKYLRVKVIGLSEYAYGYCADAMEKGGALGFTKSRSERGGRNSTYTRTSRLPSLSAFVSNNPTTPPLTDISRTA